MMYFGEFDKLTHLLNVALNDRSSQNAIAGSHDGPQKAANLCTRYIAKFFSNLRTKVDSHCFIRKQTPSKEGTFLASTNRAMSRKVTTTETFVQSVEGGAPFLELKQLVGRFSWSQISVQFDNVQNLTVKTKIKKSNAMVVIRFEVFEHRMIYFALFDLLWNFLS